MKHEINHDTGAHRIVATAEEVGLKRSKAGQWTNYSHIAWLRMHGKTYYAVTDYYLGVFHTYKIFTIEYLDGTLN